MTATGFSRSMTVSACSKKISIRVSRNLLGVFLSLFLFKMLLDLSTYHISSRLFPPYTVTINLNFAKLAESYLLLFLIAVLIPKRVRLSVFFLWILVVFSYIPMLTVYPLGDLPAAWFYIVTLFWSALMLVLRIDPVLLVLPRFRFGVILIGAISLSVLAFALLFVVVYMGISFNLDLARVYEIRREFIASSRPGVVYLLNWSAFVVLPMILMWAWERRNFFALFIVVILQLVLFSGTGHKTYLFSLFFVAGLAWLIERRRALQLTLLSLSGILMLGIFSHYLLRDVWLTGLFSNRLLILPAVISFQYFEFFSSNPLVLLSHGIFRGFVSYPYGLEPSRLIGDHYYGDKDIFANTGLLGDAFMNFGHAGLAALFVSLVILFYVIDITVHQKSLRIALGALAMPLFFLINGAFLTALLTGGVGIALLLIFFLPKKTKVEEPI